jgi:hypothetical protein
MGFEKYLPLDVAVDLPLEPYLHRWLAHLDLAFYREHPNGAGVADLAHLSDRELTLHFLQRGFAEGRAYNRRFLAFLDVKDYLERYPELKLANEWEARRHWMYRGVFEGRVPNKMTQDLLDADVHLFQMGKVASRSIDKALVRAGHRRLIPHLHWASEIVQTYTQSFLSYDEILNHDPDKELIFISGVREPLERVVSGLFQSASERKSSQSVGELTAIFNGPNAQLEAYLLPHLKLVLDWFAHGYFRGIDVYEHPFDVARGHACIRKGPVTVFLYRLDALERCWAPLSELLGRALRPETVNEAQDKDYAAPLRDALQKLRALPNGPLHDAVRSSRYWRHFFAGDDAVAPIAIAAQPWADALSRGSYPGTAKPDTANLVRNECAILPAAHLAGRWANVDVTVRTTLAMPPACVLHCEADNGASLLRLPARFGANGRLRLFLRVPAACGVLRLEPESATADLAVSHYSVRRRHFGRVLLEVLRFEMAAGPLTLARRLWRAARGARVHGWDTLGSRFLENLERNIAGYGFLYAVSASPDSHAARACKR